MAAAKLMVAGSSHNSSHPSTHVLHAQAGLKCLAPVILPLQLGLLFPACLAHLLGLCLQNHQLSGASLCAWGAGRREGSSAAAHWLGGEKAGT